MLNTELVARAMTELFTDQDAGAVDRYFADGYRQHTAVAGEDGLRGLLSNPPSGLGYELVRVLGDGDLVATHGVYSGVGPHRLVAFDLFRVDGGRITEHWDGLTPERAPNPSGRTLTDGPAQVTRPDLTENTRQVVRDFLDTVVLGGDFGSAGTFLADDYHQHNPDVGDGMKAFAAAMTAFAAAGTTIEYRNVAELIADGEFAVSVSDAVIGSGAAVWDMFRVHDGRIVEHWDLIQPLAAGSGYF